MKMVGKVTFWVFVTVVMVVEVTALRLSDFRQSDEVESDDYDTYFYEDVDSNDESDHRDYLSELSAPSFADDLHDLLANIEEMEWKRIDNLDLIDDAEDEILEMVQLNQISEVEVVGRGLLKYTFGKRVWGNISLRTFNSFHFDLKKKTIRTTLGDTVIAVNATNNAWPRAHDVKYNITYPAAGIGRNLTYVEIQVNQVKIC